MSELRAIPLGQIRAGDNDRKEFDSDELAGLALSIEVSGLATPIKVRPVDAGLDGTVWEIVAGERRFRAHQLLGLETIDAIVEVQDDERASAQMLVENLQRKDLNPVEEANAYRSRIERFGSSVEEVARIAGVSVKRVEARLSLLNLAPDVLELARVGQIKVWFATQLARLDVNRQVIALRELQRQPNMRWDDFGLLVERLLMEQEQQSMDLDDLLRNEEWSPPPKVGRRFTRTQLVETLAALVAAADEVALGAWSTDRERGEAVFTALERGRAALEWEKVNRPVTAEGASQ